MEFTLSNIIVIVVNIIALVGAYWQLRLSLKDKVDEKDYREFYNATHDTIKSRPTYERVEKMIAERAVGKVSFAELQKDYESLTKQLTEVKDSNAEIKVLLIQIINSNKKE